MKIKAATKYRYANSIKAYAIYYIVYLSLFLGEFTVCKITHNDYYYSIMWSYFTNFIFAFTMGIIAYKGELNVFIQNGLSRQDTFISFLLYLPIALINGVARGISIILCSFITQSYWYDMMVFSSMCANSDEMNKIEIVMIEMTFSTFVFVCVLACGYMFGALFNRLKTGGKIAVSIIIASCVAVIFRNRDDNNTFAETVFDFLAHLIKAFVFGSAYSNIYPSHIIAAMIMLLLFFLSAAHLLMWKKDVTK